MHSMLVALVLAAGAPAVQAGDRDGRLVSLCKLWGAVKFHHPAIHERADFDEAFLTAVPKAAAAQDASQFAAAAATLLEPLRDPLTAVVPAERAMPGGAPPPFSWRSAGPGVVAVVPGLLPDGKEGAQKKAALAEALKAAKGAVIDLRGLDVSRAGVLDIAPACAW
jgi:hypothetical protein